MNTPSKNSQEAAENVRALRNAIANCTGATQPIRSALSKCTIDFEAGFRNAEASLAIAVARILCCPAPPQRRSANTYRVDLATMQGFDPELPALYSQLAIEAMTAILNNLVNISLFDKEKLQQQYQDAIDEEFERLSKRTVLLNTAV